MSLVFVDNFDIQMQKQNFERDSFETIADMKAYPETSLPPIFHALCEEDGNLYIYNVNNADNDDTGKWRIVQGGGNGNGISEWESDHDYTIGDIVVNGNRIYRNTTVHTSSAAFSSDTANWVDLSNDDISQDTGNILSRKSDGLYVASNPVGSTTDLGLVKVDGSTIVAGTDGTISVNYTPDNKTISVNNNKKLQVNISEKDTEVLYEADFDPASTVSFEFDTESGKKYSVTLNCQFNPSESNIAIKDTTVTYNFNESTVSAYKATFTAVSTATVNINMTLVTPLPAQSRHITISNDAYNNILTTEDDGLMVNLYDNIATTSALGFVQPDGDTVTIDANGIITTMIGSNSVSRKAGQLIQLLDDGIYIDEDETVPIATTEEEGKVRLDGNTIVRVDPTSTSDGTIQVNTEVIATQDDIVTLNGTIDSVDLSTPTLVEYEEDELYEMAWSSVVFDEKPEYSTEDIDTMLDKIDFSGLSGGGGGSVTVTQILTNGTEIATINDTTIYAPAAEEEMTSDSLQSIWDEVWGE